MKTPTILKKKTRSKLTSKLSTPPVGQPLITKAFEKRKLWNNGGLGDQEVDLGSEGGSAPFGEYSLHGPERGGVELEEGESSTLKASDGPGMEELVGRDA